MIQINDENSYTGVRGVLNRLSPDASPEDCMGAAGEDTVEGPAAAADTDLDHIRNGSAWLCILRGPA